MMGNPETKSVLDIAKEAKVASRALAGLTTKVKNEALLKMAAALSANKATILAANRADMDAARERGINESLLDRLALSEARIDDMAEALRDLAKLADPVGEVIAGWKLPNGLSIRKTRVPLGVVGVIYEARPNVTVDAAGLALKSGNSVILRGGSMALQSNLALTDIISAAATQAGIPAGAIQSLPSADRESVHELMKMRGYLDLLVPRGGPGLIKMVTENASVPVLWAGAGNCHIYVHADADHQMANDITINAKVQRPSVCNAAETLLIHKDIAAALLPKIIENLEKEGVAIFGCPVTKELRPEVKAATDDDWRTEYLDLKMAVRVVDSLEAAIEHINTYGTLHSEAIITNDYEAVKKFTEAIDAAAVYVNASTRFTDGGQFGMGAEIGISTQKLHARGPMGLTAMTSTKYVIEGEGQIRA